MSIFADTLRIMIKESKLTQNDAAKAACVTPAAISQYVSGAREPTHQKMLALCRALGTTPNDLLGYHSDKPWQMQNEINLLKKKLQAVKKALS